MPRNIGGLAGIGRRLPAGIAALTASLAIASPALAVEHHPTGIFAPFADCPLSNEAVGFCTIAETTSGEFVIGKRTVPITKTTTLQGGYSKIPETNELIFYAAEDGNTLSKTPQPVPGGLLNIVAVELLPKFLQETVNKLVSEGLGGVTATAELAKPASTIKLSTVNLVFEEGVALQLPLKVKLDNTFLGNKCYIGSEAHPIILNLTSGVTAPPEPNKPISGTAGELEIEAGGALARLLGASLVDNAFAAPEATGCGGLLALVVNPTVNVELGLPAAAGHNTAILSGSKIETAGAAAVKASE